MKLGERIASETNALDVSRQLPRQLIQVTSPSQRLGMTCELDEASWCDAAIGFLGSCQVLYKLGTHKLRKLSARAEVKRNSESPFLRDSFP